LLPFEDVVVALTTKLNFSYADIIKMRVSKIKVYFLKALLIIQEENRLLQSQER